MMIDEQIEKEWMRNQDSLETVVFKYKKNSL